MEKSANIFSTFLLKLFNLLTNSSCYTFYGEPELPEELK